MIRLDPLTLLLVTWGIATLLMMGLFALQRVRRDAGIADVGWATGLGLAAILFAALGGGDPARRALLACLAAGWGFRLAWHILRDRVLHGEEDGRYRRMREFWGERAQRNFFLFFQAQALFIVFFALPLLAVAFNSRLGLHLWDWLGVGIWLVAVVGETVADRQLARFRGDPANRGKTCRAGLWRLSRHPNYFFEWLHWWAYVPLGIGSPWGWVTLLGPALMLVFLLWITGIPHTEQQALISRGEDYRDYQRTTSVLIPWFPKESVK
jgi:steroid 5-alpha reductase family enzyme